MTRPFPYQDYQRRRFFNVLLYVAILAAAFFVFVVYASVVH